MVIDRDIDGNARTTRTQGHGCVSCQVRKATVHSMCSARGDIPLLLVSIGGDFPTRKGFFDALHSGCVPVIFERTAALTQWPLHWQVALSVAPQLHTPEQRLPHSPSSSAVDPAAHNVASECVVFVPRDVAMRNMTETFAYLVRISSDVSFMYKKLECIASVAYQLQYGLPEGPQETATRRRKWGRDAFDVILEHLLS